MKKAQKTSQKSKIASANSAKDFLEYLNSTLYKLHKSYEDAFWIYYMGDHTVEKKMDDAEKRRDAFRSEVKLYEKTLALIDDKKTSSKDKARLSYWKMMFERYQSPENLQPIKDKIIELETKLHKSRAEQKEGYIDPKANKFVEASHHKLAAMMRTESDESIRKACFEALEKYSVANIDYYIKLVNYRNEYAKGLGYSDFYEYKIQIEEGMSKSELFKIFDDIYKKTKYAFKDIRTLEQKLKKEKPGLRKPWNFSYMMAGNLTKEQDPYFPFEDSIIRWGKSFSALGFDFAGGELTLDLVDRKGKYNNGFCHWPKLVSYNGNKRIPGSSNFTCNVVPGQVGTGFDGMNTLFHEGGHAAHMLNSVQTEVCLNHEYPPMSTAWAETQSMFIDAILSSIEWKMRYAKTIDGKNYPFELFERMQRELHVIRPLDLMGIMSVCELEKRIYEHKSLTPDILKKIAQEVFIKYTDRSETSTRLLDVPHLYAWGSSCSYHAYGLADIALAQWRQYFYKKYGYIVDNLNIGKEMKKVWKLGSSKSFAELVKMATGSKLSSKAYIENVTADIPKILKKAKERIDKVSKIKMSNKKIDLNATIKLVDGKKTVATNNKSFEDMAQKYSAWFKSKKSDSQKSKQK